MLYEHGSSEVRTGFRVALTGVREADEDLVQDLDFSLETRELQAEMCVWKQVASGETGSGAGDSAGHGPRALSHRALSHSGSHGGAGAVGETAGRRDGVWVYLGDWGAVVRWKERDIRAGGWVKEPYFRTGSVRESWNVGLKVAGQPRW